MSDYIERETVLRRIEEMRVKKYDYAPDVAQAIYDFVVDMDAADVAPVVHGRWEYIPQTLDTLSQFRCSVCGWWSLDPSIDNAYNYCPNCGAKMDGGDDDETD